MADLHVAGVPVLICPPTSRIPAVPATAGECSACCIQVWVSEVMRPLVDAGEARPVCDGCMARTVAQGITLVPTDHQAQRAAGMSDEDWRAVTARIAALIVGGR